MKKITLLTFFVFGLVIQLSANLSVEGSFQGKNLFIQNPETNDGFGFCITKVTVNGNVYPAPINKTAFEIDFGLLGINVGEDVLILLQHDGSCTPKVLNPEVLLPKSTFTLENLDVKKNGEIKWQTRNENGKLPFIIEQYRWNKWVNVGEVEGNGENKLNTYTFNINPHSGNNEIRIVQIDHSGKRNASKSFTFTSNVPEVEMTPKKVKDEIKFIANNRDVETKYEIFDAYGNIVKKGFGSKVNCTNLRKGAYYINFDNKNEKFIKG